MSPAMTNGCIPALRLLRLPDFGADDAEKSAVATIIARPGSFAHFASLTAEDFHLAPYKAAFEAVLSLVLQGVTPTLVTLSDELKAVAPEAAIALAPGLAYLEEDACPDGQEFALVEILTRYTACRNVAMYAPELKAAADQGIVLVDLIDAMVQVAQTTTGRRPRHQVDELICDAERRFRLLRSDEGDPYALPLDGTGIVRPLKGKNGLRQEMMLAYGLRRGTQPREGALSSATAYLEAIAETMAPEPVALRYALRKDERGEIDRVITDLGTGRFVEITTEGWRVVTMTNAIFRRSSVMLPLPDPVHGGSFDPLWKLINVDVAERDLLLAWMISVIFPGIPCPLLLVRGGQGSAKSTLARILVMLLDPSVAELRPAPERTDDWQVVTRPNRLVAFDNLRYFPRWLSDALSTAITGTAQVSRTLYTNKEIEATRIMLAVIATGIGVTPELPDLAERTLSLDLGKPPRRREEAKIMADLERHRPEILGAFYDLASAVIGAREAVEPKEHRMADFIRTVAAVDKINSSQAEKAFLARQSSLAEDAIDASPVACAVQSLVMNARDGRWHGSTGELRDRLDSKGKNKGRPGPLGSAQALRSELERLAPALEMVGILFSRAPRTECKREIVLRYDLSFDTRNQELASSGLSTNKTAGQEPIPDANDDPDDPDDLCGLISVNHSSEKDIPAGEGFPGPASRRSSRTDRQDRQIVIGPPQIAGQGANQSMTMPHPASSQLQQAAPTSPIDPPVNVIAAPEGVTVTDDERAHLTAALIVTGLLGWAEELGYADLETWSAGLGAVIRHKIVAAGAGDLFTDDLEPEHDNTEPPRTDVEADAAADELEALTLPPAATPQELRAIARGTDGKELREALYARADVAEMLADPDRVRFPEPPPVNEDPVTTAALDARWEGREAERAAEVIAEAFPGTTGPVEDPGSAPVAPVEDLEAPSEPNHPRKGAKPVSAKPAPHNAKPESTRQPAKPIKAAAGYAPLACDSKVMIGEHGARKDLDRKPDAGHLHEAALAVSGQPRAVVLVDPASHRALGLQTEWHYPDADSTEVARTKALTQHPLAARAIERGVPGVRIGSTKTGALVIESVKGTVEIDFPRFSKDFYDPKLPLDLAQLVGAQVKLRDALKGTSYSISGANSVKATILRNSLRAKDRSLLKIPPSLPEPVLSGPGWVDSDHFLPQTEWLRDLTKTEETRGYVRAFDRNGSYASVMHGLYLGVGEWHKGPAELPLKDTQSAYYLVDLGKLRKSYDLGHGRPDPFSKLDGSDLEWLTTTEAQYARQLADKAGLVIPVIESFVQEDQDDAFAHCYLEPVGDIIRSARETLGADESPEARAALRVLKGGYSTVVAWFEFAEKVGDRLGRPYWRRSVIGRFGVNLHRSLAKAEGASAPAFATCEIDTALWALDGPDEMPAGLPIGKGFGEWKPKGKPVPMSQARKALHSGDLEAVLQMTNKRE
jgi:hypothetical protein